MFFRSQSAASKLDRGRGNTRIKWLYEIIVPYLRKFVSLPKVNLPVLNIPSNPLKLGNDEIENIAIEVRRGWGLGDGPISNTVLLIENNGFIVTRMDLGSPTLDAFSTFPSVIDKTPYVILGADKQSAVRSRFDKMAERRWEQLNGPKKKKHDIVGNYSAFCGYCDTPSAFLEKRKANRPFRMRCSNCDKHTDWYCRSDKAIQVWGDVQPPLKPKEKHPIRKLAIFEKKCFRCNHSVEVLQKIIIEVASYKLKCTFCSITTSWWHGTTENAIKEFIDSARDYFKSQSDNAVLCQMCGKGYGELENPAFYFPSGETECTVRCETPDCNMHSDLHSTPKEAWERWDMLNKTADQVYGDPKDITIASNLFMLNGKCRKCDCPYANLQKGRNSKSKPFYRVVCEQGTCCTKWVTYGEEALRLWKDIPYA